MSSTRKNDDGLDSGRDVGTVERGNTDVDENEIDQHAPAEEPEGPDRVKESPSDKNIEKKEEKKAKEEEKPKPKKRKRVIRRAPSVSYPETDDKDRYLITYADLITLLLGLFIILYAISKIDLQKYQQMMNVMGDVFGNKVENVSTGSGKPGTNRNGGTENSPMPELKSKLRSLIDTYNYGDSFSLQENERGLTVRIQDDIIFPSGSAELNENFKNVLIRLGRILKNIPNDIRIEGHTDNVPINTPQYPSNWHLSVARALNTAYFLISQSGMSQDKVSVVGYSEYRPIDTNETPEGRQRNRRVDIVIIKE
ncbi:MAG: chemotaxis protein MotB [Ignavibacteria bacterium]|nr:MAG: chemotaxis protein MotB [Ignavibacteria bacterium]